MCATTDLKLRLKRWSAHDFEVSYDIMSPGYVQLERGIKFNEVNRESLSHKAEDSAFR